MFKRSLFLGLIFIVGSTTSYYATSISLQQYLENVKRSHQTYQSSVLVFNASGLRKAEASVPYQPQLFLNLARSSDSKRTNFSSFQGINTNTYDFSAGLAWQSELGLKTQLGYHVMYNSHTSANAASLPVSSYYDGVLSLDLTLPLWRNVGGAETGFGVKSNQLELLSNAKQAQFEMKQLLLQAELAYWQLSLASEAVAVQKSALERAKKTVSWTLNRSKLGLAEDSDVLQAKAVLAIRNIDLNQAKDDLKEAVRLFYSQIGTTDKAVPVLSESMDTLLETSDFSDKAVREDLEAAQLKAKSREQQALLAYEKLKPSFDLIASAALNRRDTTLDGTFSNAFNLDTPTYYAGFRLSMPLDGGATSKILDGLKKEIEASSLRVSRQQFELEREWDQAIEQFKSAKQVYKLNKDLEEIQKKKWQAESVRHSNGKTTLYQVLVFEQDFANAQFSRLRAETVLMLRAAKLKLFRSL